MIRKKRFSFIENCGPTLLVLGALAVLLRLVGIAYGLPAVFNGDEPHIVNTAVSFGRGSLNPLNFKYPTLWMYSLFAVYGGFFVAWGGAGFWHSLREFGELFVWNPGIFYLLARLLSAVFGLWAIERIYRAGKELAGERAGMWAAGLAVVSPPLVEAAHTGKPDSLMFFWSACAWLCAVRYYKGGRAAYLAFLSSAVGLAVSTQYTAAPLAALLPAAWWARRMRGEKGTGIVVLAACGMLMPAFFFAGSPYIVLDFPAFKAGFTDNWRAYGGDNAGAIAGWKPLWNLLSLAGHWSTGGLTFVAGAIWLVRKERALAALLLIVPSVFVLFFALQAEGGWMRYLFGCLPGVFLACAVGIEALMAAVPDTGRRLFSMQTAALTLLLLPGAIESWAMDSRLRLPDTRTLASEWIEKNIPQGSRILSDHEADSPRIRYSLEHALELLKRTSRAGHARARYYELMVSGHPGGGYEVWQVDRDPAELHAGPGHAAWSSAGRPVLNVDAGLKAARAAGIEFVVLTSYGAAYGASPKLARFLSETREQGVLLSSFSPLETERGGPDIWIYRINSGGRGS